MWQEAYSSLTEAQTPYKYDYDKRVRKTPVFKSKGLEFVNMLPPAVCENTSKMTDKPTYI